jgi:hypothetical protein
MVHRFWLQELLWGFWNFTHEYRTDFCMTMLLLFILYYEGGKFPVDNSPDIP